MFLGYYRHFRFFEFRGGRKNLDASRRGGGRKILDVSLRGGEQFWILNFLESLGKIKGHV